MPGRIVENPFMPFCRTQVNLSYDCDILPLSEKMPGFHWITIYGDYFKGEATTLSFKLDSGKHNVFSVDEVADGWIL